MCVFGHWLYVHEEGNVKKELERSTNHWIGLNWIGLGIGLDWWFLYLWWYQYWIGGISIGLVVSVLDWWYQYWIGGISIGGGGISIGGKQQTTDFRDEDY